MDKLYMIIGYSNSYGFFHGMYDYDFIWTQPNDFQFLWDAAKDLSHQVIEDYLHIFEEEGDYESEEDLFNEEAIAEVYSVSSIVKNIEDGEELINELGIDEFITRYCECV